MKTNKKKHPFAALFMAAAIIAAVPLGINSSLSELREEASDSYYYDQGGYAIYEGLEKRRAAASDLVTLAKRYTDKEPSLEALADDLEYQVRCAERALLTQSVPTRLWIRPRRPWQMPWSKWAWRRRIRNIRASLLPR